MLYGQREVLEDVCSISPSSDSTDGARVSLTVECVTDNELFKSPFILSSNFRGLTYLIFGLEDTLIALARTVDGLVLIATIFRLKYRT